MGSPVAGLRPMRALRSTRRNFANPEIVTSSPVHTVSVMTSTSDVMSSSASLRDMSLRSASAFNNWLRFTVAGLHQAVGTSGACLHLAYPQRWISARFSGIFSACQHGCMVSTDDLRWLDATAQAELVRTGAASALELVDAAIARIEAANDRLNAVIHPRFERAREEARDENLTSGPFRGVPFLVKDGVCHTAGEPFHCGMRVLKEIGWTEPDDTWLAQRFRAAGFVTCGKTNLPELAASVTTE